MSFFNVINILSLLPHYNTIINSTFFHLTSIFLILQVLTLGPGRANSPDNAFLSPTSRHRANHPHREADSFLIEGNIKDITGRDCLHRTTSQPQNIPNLQ